MPATPHLETHFEASETVRDVVIGMSDGLTVPFALAAGLTGIAAASSKLVVIAGLAEIAAAYIAGGLIPLSSYIVVDDLHIALIASVIVTLIALFFFGFFKARLTGVNPIQGGLRTVVIGGLASAAAFGLARWIS